MSACRAAALLAGVDPVGYGLLRSDGETYRLAPKAVPIEAFVNYLSDHDYVLSRPRDVRRRQRVGPSRHRRVGLEPILAWRSAIELYRTLSDNGDQGFEREVDSLLRAP